MTMNPRDYDLSELQGGGDVPFGMGGEGRNDAPNGSGSRADETVRSNQYRELLMLESMGDDLEKPYLDALPDTYAAEIAIFEWLEFVLAKAGFKRTLDVLGYYREMDWITESVESALREYMRCCDAPAEPTAELDRSDHVLSLVYVARLASMGE